MNTNWTLEPRLRHFVLEDYQGPTPRWCPSCGNHSVIAAVQRLCRDLQLAPEKTVVVSGIGCSSRLPHHMNTYGVHSLHGRAFPFACGVRARRPDLNIFVVTGDGDCCAIGTAHWIHAIRYNMKMTVLLLDNSIYGLTKKQTSPTSPKHTFTNTHPLGSPLEPINPLSIAVSVTNASFVAQTVDWIPDHLYETLKRATAHDGFAFVRIRQRCPHFMAGAWDEYQKNPNKIQLLTHPDGVPVSDTISNIYTQTREHDPHNLAEAHEIAQQNDPLPLGLLYYNPNADHYDRFTQQGLIMSPEEKLEALEKEFDKYAV